MSKSDKDLKTKSAISASPKTKSVKFSTKENGPSVAQSSPDTTSASEWQYPALGQFPAAYPGYNIGTVHYNTTGPHTNPFFTNNATALGTYTYNLQAQPVFMMPDYQNAAPPTIGQNYQPPVPDTSMGPMHHTYIPRFDNQAGTTFVAVPCGQVGFPSYYFVTNPACPPPAPRAVVVPGNYVYFRGDPVIYYASVLGNVICIQVPSLGGS
jgi:hypothetical protein